MPPWWSAPWRSTRWTPCSTWPPRRWWGRAPVIRSDGTLERDFLYVEDAVAAYLAVADVLDREPPAAAGEAFNAGTGDPTSVLELVGAVCVAAGVDLEPEVRAQTRAEISRQYVDSSRLRALTG